jgi:hypothetical protein
VACLLTGFLLFAAQPASATNPTNVTGKVFTTFPDGHTVNGNIYPSKDQVYLNGGPQNEHANGMSPDGIYYFQVTDPSGKTLLSTDDITCRQVVVSGGKIVGVPAGAPPASCTEPAGSATPGAFHNIGTTDPASGETPVQLCAPSRCPAGQPDFLDTPNHGGEYKVWATPVGDYDLANCAGNYGFCSNQSDTDNFKVRSANLGFVTVCKFNDLSDNGAQDSGEPLIPHWPITATGVVTGSSDSGTLVTQTDDNGCVSFSVKVFNNPDGTGTVTLTEGTLGSDWTQTSPGNGACTLTGNNVNAKDTCSVSGATPASGVPASGGVITITVSNGDDVDAPNFGNFNPSCTAACNGQQILVTKTANPVVSYTWNIQKNVDKTTIDTSGSATANYTVTVTHDNGTATMTGSIRISNPFGPDLSGIAVTDTVSDSGSPDDGVCTVTTPAAVTAGDGTITVLAGTHVDATYSCTFSGVPAAGLNTNTATATWTANGGGTAIGTAGFDFGNATLVDNITAVTDSLAGNLGTVIINSDGSTSCITASSGFNGSNLACSVSGSTAIFTYSLTFNDPAGTCTTHPNTAAFTTNTNGTTGTASQSVQVCVGSDLVVSKTAATSFTRTYNWTISKTAGSTIIDAPSGTTATANYTVVVGETGFNDSAWQVTGTITISNPNDWETITPTSVTDALDPGSNGTCTVNDGNPVGTIPAKSLGVNGSVTVPYTCTFSGAPSPSSGTNTATANWNGAESFTPDSSAQGMKGYDFASATINKVNASITPTDAFNGGAGVNLCVLDPTGPCTLNAVDAAPFTTHTYNYSRSITVPIATCTTFPNTASTGLTGAGQTSSASVKICGASPLTVTKTAATTYNAGITKTPGQKSPDDVSGPTTTLTYTIKVTESGWVVSGNITVTNPNDWEAITVNLSDGLSILGGICAISGGTTQTVSAATVAVTTPGSISPAYTCTFATAPAASGNNTATATWNAATFFTSTGSASSGPVPFAFALLTVTDQFNGGTTKTLGSKLVPAASYTFTDSYTVSVPAGSCTTFPNTATVTATGTGPLVSVTLNPANGTASASVTVCNTQTGALTMGFWKNNNGQGIITKSCGGTSGVSLDTFLRQFNPFQDLSATATCKQDATYVAGVMGGATCTSSTGTCNAMLRAQMLATALDVYFSDPTLGGNQIGAFNGLGNKTPALGGVAIDLSKICDGSDGGLGGSCPEDARPEFGIAPPALGTTVGLMLLYSDFLSGVNGSPVASSTNGASWYQQIKSRQVIAKDAFDAINNQIAPIAPPGTTASPSF